MHNRGLQLGRSKLVAARTGPDRELNWSRRVHEFKIRCSGHLHRVIFVERYDFRRQMWRGGSWAIPDHSKRDRLAVELGASFACLRFLEVLRKSGPGLALQSLRYEGFDLSLEAIGLIHGWDQSRLEISRERKRTRERLPWYGNPGPIYADQMLIREDFVAEPPRRQRSYRRLWIYQRELYRLLRPHLCSKGEELYVLVRVLRTSEEDVQVIVSSEEEDLVRVEANFGPSPGRIIEFYPPVFISDGRLHIRLDTGSPYSCPVPTGPGTYVLRRA